MNAVGRNRPSKPSCFGRAPDAFTTPIEVLLASRGRNGTGPENTFSPLLSRTVNTGA